MRLTPLLLALALATAASARSGADGTIFLQWDPEPPGCVVNPGGTLSLTWDIRITSTPAYVLYQLEDTTRTIVLDYAIYPAASGLRVEHTWLVPRDTPGGEYWIRLEYWSAEHGIEAVSEVSFLICTEQTPVPNRDTSWGRLKAAYR